MKLTIEAIENQKCTGCGACAAVCPKKAIQLEYNNEGFLFPKIQQEQCALCGKCYKACPLEKETKTHFAAQFFVVQLRERNALLQSASGGAFYGLASYILKNKGVVFGCVLDVNMLPVHSAVTQLRDLHKLQGSKYVQSFVAVETYEQVKLFLIEGKWVLFSGTPCQTAGLLNYLDKTYDNLITIDVICHGVASRGVYLNYLKGKERQLGEAITNVKFRCKDIGVYPNNHSFHIESSNHVSCVHALKDPFTSSFYHNRILRESCYQCEFASKERVSDLTLGDFGEIEHLPMDFSYKDGYSVVSANTEAGMTLLKASADFFEIRKLDYEYSQSNLTKATHRPKKRNAMRKMHFDIDRPDEDIGLKLQITIADRIKYFLPKSVKESIKRIIKW